MSLAEYRRALSGHIICRSRRSLELNGRVGRAKRADKTAALALHIFVFSKAGSNFAKNSRSVRIRWIYDSIVHPLAFAPRANDTRSPQISQMPRYFGLTLSEYLNKETHAHFVVSDKVEQAQTRLVSQSAKQLVHIKPGSLFGHALDSTSEHIRLALCIERPLYSHTFGKAYVAKIEEMVNASTQHEVVWGGLRFFLGLAQMWLAIVGLTLLALVGLRPVTLAVVIAATVARVVSRLLYRSRPNLSLKERKSD